MEYKGEITKENEQYVREIESLPNFNNGHGHLPNGMHREGYKQHMEGKEHADVSYRLVTSIWDTIDCLLEESPEMKVVASRIVELHNEQARLAKEAVVMAMSGRYDGLEELTEKEDVLKREKHELFQPFYIALREAGFEQELITGAGLEKTPN